MTSYKHTVDAEADAKLFFVRLDVNVGSAAAQRVDQQHVDQSDDRRVFAHARERGEIDLFVVFNYFDVFSAVGDRSRCCPAKRDRRE